LYYNLVLGEFKSWDSLLSNRHETKDIINPAENNKVITKDAPNTVPDQIMVHGTLTPSGAPITIHYRGGKPFPGTPGIEWRIQGDKGEIHLTSASWSLNVGPPDTKIELFDAEAGEVEVIVPERDRWDELPVPAQNIARMYEAFRKGEWFPNFEWAVRRHAMIEEMWRRYDASQTT
jgi:predicted dehydrogenase